MTEQLTFSAAQQAAWRNKKTKGFGTTDVATEFCLLYGEVGEAFDAWRKTARRARAASGASSPGSGCGHSPRL